MSEIRVSVFRNHRYMSGSCLDFMAAQAAEREMGAWSHVFGEILRSVEMRDTRASLEGELWKSKN